MDDLPALTGVTGAAAVTGDAAAARLIGEQLAAEAGVASVAVHTDADDADDPDGNLGDGSADRAGWALLRATGDAELIIEACRALPNAVSSPTRSRRLRRHRVRWEPGGPTPGVSMVFDVYRRPGMSGADFHRHWRDSHGPVALAHHLGMWDYDQVSVADGGRIPLDGIAVVSFPTAADVQQRFFDTDLGAAVVRADAASFTDAHTLGRRPTTEWILKDDAAPADGGAHDWADHRSVDLDAPPDDVWAVLGDFGGILDWWPGGLDSISVDPGPPPTRTLGRAGGSSVTESLLHHRPAERMFQLRVDTGFPPSVTDYTCRYELRPRGTGCRLDWMPRARVSAGREADFFAIVDGGWDKVANGLGARFSS